MESITVFIVEDEAILAMDLTQRLTDMGYHIMGVADNGPEALAGIQEHDCDLVLFDINIRGEWDGIETARRLREIRSLPFIFLTALTDGPTIERARQVGPSAYILKPFTDLNLRISMDLAIHNFALSQPAGLPGQPPLAESVASQKNESLLLINRQLFVKQNYRFIRFLLDDVLFLQSDGNYTDIVTRDNKYTLRVMMNKVIDRMQCPDIMRVHRSYAVHARHIINFSESEVTVDKYTVPIGRSYRHEFVKALKLI